MKNSDEIYYGYDGAVYCPECLPNGVTPETEECDPAFAGEEGDSIPVCDLCGYDFVGEVSLIKE